MSATYVDRYGVEHAGVPPDDDDFVDLGEEDEEDPRGDEEANWRRQAVTAKHRQAYAEQRKALLVQLVGTALGSADSRVVAIATRINALDEVVKFLGGKTMEEEAEK